MPFKNRVHNRQEDKDTIILLVQLKWIKWKEIQITKKLSTNH